MQLGILKGLILVKHYVEPAKLLGLGMGMKNSVFNFWDW